MFNIPRLVGIGFAFLGSVVFCAVAIWMLAELVPAPGIVEALVAVGLFVVYFAGVGSAFWYFYRDGRFHIVVIFLTLVGSTALALILLAAALLGLSQVGKGAGLPLLLVIVLFHVGAVRLFSLSAEPAGRVPALPGGSGGGASALARADAYLRDRRAPCAGLRHRLLLALPGYYWVWHQWHAFDRRLGRVADLLEQGYSLSEALAAVPGVASRETVMLASLGQATARLDVCLRHSLQQCYAAVWLEAIPRLAYPIALLFFLSGITGFWVVFIYPRLERIFKEFDQELPWQTALLGNVCHTIADFPWLVPACLLALLAVASVLIGSATARWYFPGIARLYRGHIQGQVLRLLGLLLAAGKTVPESLRILADSDYFAPVAQRRLREVGRRVEQGEPLAVCLSGGRLVPAAFAPLVQAAEQLRNLPWALTELGEHIAGRTIRLIRRLSLLVAPVTVFAVGLIIGFGVIAMFVPLLQLMESFQE